MVLMQFSQFLDTAHISTLNCDEMAGDRPRQRQIFSAKHIFQQSKSWPPRFKEAGAGGHERWLTIHLKSGYFTAVILRSMKTVAERHRHAVYYNKHWWLAFFGVNIGDFEWPWTPKIGFLVNFFAIFGCNTHFKSELHRNGWRWI